MPRSSRSFLFPDVNVWLALTYEGHVHHPAAKQWFEELDVDARLVFCRLSQISLLRLLTTQAVMGDEVMTQAKAWRCYDRWLEDSRVILLDEPPIIEQAFRSLSQQTRPSPKDWADAYLAAFASASGMRLVTFDQALLGKVNGALILKA
jgi:uncharacterized protein